MWLWLLVLVTCDKRHPLFVYTILKSADAGLTPEQNYRWTKFTVRLENAIGFKGKQPC